MSRFVPGLLALAVLFLPLSAASQVVETDPSPPRTDKTVTIFFNADEGTGGLANHDGDVYAHTGISTDQNPRQAWKCVKNHWPTDESFQGNRSDTKLTKVSTNRYKLVISDIRSYYQATSTSCSLAGDERIETMNFVFRNADGSKEGKAEGNEDIFVDVFDVSGTEPVIESVINNPTSSKLYPLVTTEDTTVTVSLSAEVARSNFVNLQVLVNGDRKKTGSFGNTSLSYDLNVNSPGRYEIEAVANGQTNNGNNVSDTTRTVVVRTPSVTTQSRPAGVKDGINEQSGSTVTFSLNAPNTDFAYLLGDFNNWTIDNDYFMKKDGDHWWVTVDNLQPGKEYAFQYFVDGEARVADPFSKQVLTPEDESISETTYPNLKAYPDSVTENVVSLMETGSSDFNFSSFAPPPQDEMVVYELLLRDFLKKSNYKTLTDTLDYLDRLGVNAIELMPVSEFGGNSSWGYNPSFHFALDKSYGTPRQFKKFVEAAHQRGIAVILDVVYNHITNQSPLYQIYGSTAGSPFLEAGAGVCGGFFEKLKHGTPFINNYIDRANEYWIEEYNVDGFRFDLAKCLGGESGVKRIADHIWDNVDKDAYVILEYFAGTAEEQRLANYRDDEPGIEGMIPWHKLSPQYGEAGMGYVNNGGISSNISGSYFGFAGFNDPSVMSYMESHDEQWLMHKFASFGNANAKGTYDIKKLKTALNRQKLLGAFFFTVPGPRMTWQFAELGYGYKKDECLQDDGNANNCHKSAPGRTGEKPVRWEYRDPQQSPNRVRLYKTWQALLRLRNQYEVFSAERGFSDPDESINMKAGDTDYVRWIKLQDEKMDAVIVGNFDVIERTAQVDFPSTGTWHNFFMNRSRQVNSTQSLTLRPGEFHVFTSKPVAPPEPGLLSFPDQRSTQSVSASGTKDFGNTGVDINFASGTSGAGDVTVKRFERGPFRADINRANVSSYRYVIEAGGNLDVGSGTEVRLDVSTLEGINDPNKVDVYSRSTPNKGNFSKLSTSYDSGAGELVATTGSFSEFVLASNTESLPVEMTGLEAVLTGQQAVRLSWQTASETNNAGFEVQRRVAVAGPSQGGRQEGSSWNPVDFVEGAGTTSKTQSYQVEDTIPFRADSVHYRLKQVDADGSSRFSDPVSVVIGAPDQLDLRAPFPNPGRNRITVQYAVPTQQKVSVVLYDVLGRRVRTIARGPTEGRREQTVDVSGLSSGTYLLRLRGEEGVDTQRLTVVK